MQLTRRINWNHKKNMLLEPLNVQTFARLTGKFDSNFQRSDDFRELCNCGLDGG